MASIALRGNQMQQQQSQQQPRYQVVESTDLRTGVKSYRIYLRNSVGPSVTGDFKTREEAETELVELIRLDGLEVK